MSKTYTIALDSGASKDIAEFSSSLDSWGDNVNNISQHLDLKIGEIRKTLENLKLKGLAQQIAELKQEDKKSNHKNQKLAVQSNSSHRQLKTLENMDKLLGNVVNKTFEKINKSTLQYTNAFSHSLDKTFTQFVNKNQQLITQGVSSLINGVHNSKSMPELMKGGASLVQNHSKEITHILDFASKKLKKGSRSSKILGFASNVFGNHSGIVSDAMNETANILSHKKSFPDVVNDSANYLKHNSSNVTNLLTDVAKVFNKDSKHTKRINSTAGFINKNHNILADGVGAVTNIVTQKPSASEIINQGGNYLKDNSKDISNLLKDISKGFKNSSKTSKAIQFTSGLLGNHSGILSSAMSETASIIDHKKSVSDVVSDGVGYVRENPKEVSSLLHYASKGLKKGSKSSKILSTAANFMNKNSDIISGGIDLGSTLFDKKSPVSKTLTKVTSSIGKSLGSTKGLKMLTKLNPKGLAVAGLDIASNFVDKDSTLGKGINAVTSFADKHSGMLMGAQLGAEIGTIIPGVGNLIGAAAGGLIGGAYDWYSHRKEEKEKQKITIDYDKINAKYNEREALYQEDKNTRIDSRSKTETTSSEQQNSVDTANPVSPTTDTNTLSNVTGSAQALVVNFNSPVIEMNNTMKGTSTQLLDQIEDKVSETVIQALGITLGKATSAY